MPKLTPMLKQYFSIKEEHPDSILFFRMGDFFEMFFEDAQKAAPILEIALTSRSKHEGQDIPMCGVPHQAADLYIDRLIKQGCKVAICDQIEDPRQAKGIVARKVTRVITPGMVLSPELNDPKTPRFLTALSALPEGTFGLAGLELSTGEFVITQVSDRRILTEELVRFSPAEVLIDRDDAAGLGEISTNLGLYSTYYESEVFHPARARKILADHFGEHALTGFGIKDLDAALSAAGAALSYAQETQGHDLAHLDRIRRYIVEDHMVLDEVTQRNLELFETMRDHSRIGALIGIIDLTATAMGGRKMRQWIGYPLLDRPQVAERHEAVEYLVLDGLGRADLQELLTGVQDLERLIGRISLGRAGPRDLASLLSSLQKLPALSALLTGDSLGGLIRDLGDRLDPLTDLTDLIGKALVDHPPATLKDGGLFQPGYHPKLDELNRIVSDGKGWMARLEQEERSRTGINSLKIGYNRVFGYYIEVTRANLHLVPESYIRKQTLAGAERFITPELKEQEETVLTAGERRLELEQQLFEELRQKIAAQGSRIRETAGILAEVDVLAALAQAAVKYDYVRPELLDDDRIEIDGGRHPVIERLVKGEPFVANDLKLDNDTSQVLIITGPNMAGKSTILRQTALIVLMNQMGGFVPAEKARLGMVGRIFTRVGASDDLARGRSTFMVEMNETAQILHQATPSSLVILDEIGRGTSTFDGLSIAWAVAEYLHDLKGVGVRTLFATHYHELVQLAKTKSRVKNFNVAIKEYDGKVIFLRKLLAGGTSRSYGLAVARLAGLPVEVLDRAAEVLEGLEKGRGRPGLPKFTRPGKDPASTQMSLFDEPDEQLAQKIKELNLDDMTPLNALNTLADLKRQAGK